MRHHQDQHHQDRHYQYLPSSSSEDGEPSGTFLVALTLSRAETARASASGSFVNEPGPSTEVDVHHPAVSTADDEPSITPEMASESAIVEPSVGSAVGTSGVKNDTDDDAAAGSHNDSDSALDSATPVSYDDEESEIQPYRKVCRRAEVTYALKERGAYAHIEKIHNQDVCDFERTCDSLPPKNLKKMQWKACP